jgi:hypothetical protein
VKAGDRMNLDLRNGVVDSNDQERRPPSSEPGNPFEDSREFPVEGTNAPAVHETTLERHYTVKDVAEMWRLDEKIIRRIFGDEPGVVSHRSC